MPHTGRWIVGIVLGLLLAAPVSVGQTPQPKKAPKTLHKKTHHKQIPPPPMQLPPMPSGPLPQVPMDQLPPVPPRISYQNGLLTIVAQNSTLTDILREVHNRTGASIDVPANAGERVVTRLGPGPARDILASLLNGSTFNYVMLGSASDPEALTTVILTMKTAGGPGTAVASASPPNPGIPPTRVPPIQPAPAVPAMSIQASSGEEDKAEENADEQDAEDNADQEQTPGVPGQPPANTNTGTPPGSPEPNAGPKTPEQILDMMRKLPQPPQVPQTPPPGDQEPPE